MVMEETPVNWPLKPLTVLYDTAPGNVSTPL